MAAASELVPRPLKLKCGLVAKSAWELLKEEEESGRKETALRTGCPALDCFFGGFGLRPGIHEVSGESGSGKTRLALQLCVQSLITSTKEVIYFDTYGNRDGLLSIELRKLSEKVRELDTDTIMQSVRVISESDKKQQIECLVQLIPKRLRTHATRLLIIDSIARIFRRLPNDDSSSLLITHHFDDKGLINDDDNNPGMSPLRSDASKSNHSSYYIDRAKEMHVVCNALRSCVAEFPDLCVLVLNEVSDTMDDDLVHLTSDYGTVLGRNGQRKHAALGLAFSNLIDSRFMLMRVDKYQQKLMIDAEHSDDVDRQEQKIHTLRFIQCIWSPSCPSSSDGRPPCEIQIDEHGRLRAVGEVGDLTDSQIAEDESSSRTVTQSSRLSAGIDGIPSL